MADDHDHSLQEQGINGAADIARAIFDMIRSKIWVFAVIAAGLVAGEVGLRMIRPDLAGLVYGPDRTGGHPVFLSDKRFRIAQADARNDDPVIIALGDSTTFGTGVAAQDTWPLQLGSRSIANAGSAGAGLGAIVARLAGPWAQPEPPKVVLLLVTGNMVSFTQFRENADARDPLRRFNAPQQPSPQPASLKRRAVELLQASAVWKSLSLNVEIFKFAIGLQTHRTDPGAPLSPLLAYGWVQPDLPEDFIAQMWDTFQGELVNLKQETDALGACLVIGFLPPRFMLSDRISDNLKFVPANRLATDAAARVGGLAQTMQVPFVDMTGPLTDARAGQGFLDAPLFIPGDYTHLSAQGHAVVADAFAQELAAQTDCQ